MSITDNLGFYIGNPGTHVRRPAASPDVDPASPVLHADASELPEHHAVLRGVPAGSRRPSAATTAWNSAWPSEPTGKWFGKLSYTYSKLTGNYAGLTNTDPTDGDHRPPRSEQQPPVRSADHDLSAQRQDRRRSAVHRPSAHRQGLRLLSPEVGCSAPRSRRHADRLTRARRSTPACRWSAPLRPASGPKAAARFTNFTRAANGDFVISDIVKDARTDPFIQTDLSVHHEIPVHEGQRLEFEANVINVFNQRASAGCLRDLPSPPA